MLDTLKLSRWLKHSESGAKAKNDAKSIATRWDVEQGNRKPGSNDATPGVVIEGEWYEIPPDLRDTRPRLYRTAPDPVTGRQGRVSGRILPDDLVGGAPSSAVPLLLAFIPFVALMLFWAVSIGSALLVVPTVILLGVSMAFIANATSTSGKSWAFMSLLAALLPLKTITDALLKQALGGGGYGSTASIVAMAAIVGVALLFGGIRAARATTGVVLGVLLTLFLADQVGELLKPAILLAPACALPWGWSFYLRRSRGIELAIYGTTCNWEDSDNGLGHIEARRAQTYRAALEYAKCK